MILFDLSSCWANISTEEFMHSNRLANSRLKLPGTKSCVCIPVGGFAVAIDCPYPPR